MARLLRRPVPGLLPVRLRQLAEEERFAFQTRGFRLALDAGEETRIGRGMAVEGFNVATAGAASQQQALELY